ncbi:olfactory receptor 51M1-like [Xenopus laevis]|uniref:Olfactory receptor 51M1-like n=1 Tax=Xenopus laevis TaxID=8355 RepID=A0A8J0UIT5_XENLA|nr:olfactory receptor 51M1-like [Xenopus laevis]
MASHADVRVPIFPEVRMKDTVKVAVEEKFCGEKGLRFIGEKILFGLCGLKKEDILCIQDFPKAGVYDVTFVSQVVCQNFHHVYSQHKDDPLLEGSKTKAARQVNANEVTVLPAEPEVEEVRVQRSSARVSVATTEGPRFEEESVKQKPRSNFPPEAETGVPKAKKSRQTKKEKKKAKNPTQDINPSSGEAVSSADEMEVSAESSGVQCSGVKPPDGSEFHDNGSEASVSESNQAMATFTTAFHNMTELSSTTTITGVVTVTLITALLVAFCIFLYFVTVLLYVFFTTSHVRETARYVLFAHMLINDTLFLSISCVLFIATSNNLCIPVPMCCAMGSFCTASFLVTPYNLAIMSLERQVAICHPLRHSEFCTGQRANSAISVMWLVGLIPVFIELGIMKASAENNFYSLNIVCLWSNLIINPIQNTIRFISIVIGFTVVGLTITVTYVKVMAVARRIASGKTSASKAGRTVLLHAIQLLLCMMSFTSSFTDTFLQRYFAYIHYINFFLLLLLPRCISPIIYGIRDEVFQKRIATLWSHIS